jgi:hypothetical protein
LIALGCVSGSGNLVDIDGNLPLLAVDPNGVEILPELLPPKTVGGDREPLLKADLFNQALTLQGSLDVSGVPGFKLTSNFGTLADSNPNILPSVEIDLASLEFQVPEIQATGGVNGDSLKADGRADFLKLLADVDGIATMSGTMPPFGAGISLVDVGSGATNFKISASLDALDIDMGPALGIAQDFELTPTLMTKILFSAPVMIAGAMVDFWEGVWDQLPEITLFKTTTFSPTFYLDVLLDHQMALDLGLGGTLDLFKASLTASMGGVKLLGGEISLNQLLGLGNTLFQTSRVELPIWAKEFALMGFSEIEGAAFTVQVPVPATLILFVGGLGLLLAAKRRCMISAVEPGLAA